MAADLDRGLLGLEVLRPRQRRKPLLDRLVMKLRHLAAALADGEGGDAVVVLVIMRAATGDEGVQALLVKAVTPWSCS